MKGGGGGRKEGKNHQLDISHSIILILLLNFPTTFAYKLTNN